MAASRQQIIDKLKILIESGKSYSYCLGVSATKWGLKKNTFNRYWKKAQQQHTEAQDVIKKAKMDIDIQNAVAERKGQIADINERKEILTQILRGEILLQKPIVVGKFIEMIDVVPDWMDRKNAIAELNKMEGDYAPTKLAQTDKDGNNVTPTVMLTLPPGLEINLPSNIEGTDE